MQADVVPIRSYADENLGARFGIRPASVAIGTLLPHRHDYFEILFFVTGGPKQRISIRECGGGSGSIFFIAPMTPHQARFRPSDACFVIYFDLAFLRPELGSSIEIDSELLSRAPEMALFAYQNDIDFVLSDADVKRLESLCERMVAERENPRLCSREVIRSQLAMLLCEVAQRYEGEITKLVNQRPPGGGAERHVKGVIKFIAENFAKKIMLTDAADKVAVSPNYLATLLKRETGKTFVELVTEKRIDRACELLTFTGLRISQVSDAVGFVDFDYFCRRFKQITGETALQFRARNAVAQSAGPAARRA